SAYHTVEQEYFDIFAAYFLGEVDTDLGSETLGDVKFNRAIGSQLNHARNDLDALIVNGEIKGFHDLNDKQTQIEWGFKYTREDIRDRVVEWEVIDSAGFSLNPPTIDFPQNTQPYTPYVGPLVPYQNVRALNFVTIDRLSGYLQWSRKASLGSSQIWMNAGIRAQNWTVEGGDAQTTISPRAQFSIKPDWDRDIVFRVSGGLYHQPPSYRELRDFNGVVQSDVKAQQSVHFVLAGDYSFRMWDRPFRMVSELYYK